MLKKMTTFLISGIVICFAVIIFSNNCYSQRGQKSIGFIGGYATYNESGYANVYFQYTLSSHFRLSSDLGYIFKNNDLSGFNFNIDAHFPFKIYKGINIYPFGGLTFNNWKHEPINNSVNKFGINIGGGIDIYFTSNLKIFVQGKYSFMDKTDGGFVGAGVGYVF